MSKQVLLYDHLGFQEKILLGKLAVKLEVKLQLC